MKKKLIFLLLIITLAFSGCESSKTSTSDIQKSSSREASNSIEPVYEEGSFEKELQDYAVKIIMENYMHTDIESLTINENLGTEEDGDYIILAKLTWNQKNKASTSLNMLSMYSSDFAARIGTDQPPVNEVAIFWTIPYLENANAKWSYERSDYGMYLSDSMMDSVFDQ